MRILVIDPGSTSTKFGVYENNQMRCRWNISHDRRQIEKCSGVSGQEDMRYLEIEKLLSSEGLIDQKFDAVAGRGGLIKPVTSGTYEVNDTMLGDLKSGKYGQHASNLGGILARRFAKRFSVTAYVMDPVVVDELGPNARLSGLKEVQRRSIFHALNQKATARRVAARIGKPYDTLNLIVAHLGGGISIGAHAKGRVVDVNNALDGDGPYAPERAGGIPVGDCLRLIQNDTYTPEALIETLSRKGGLYSYLGEVDLTCIVQRISEGDQPARTALEGMAYQVSKEIGSMATVLEGRVDGIVLTGGGAHCELLVSLIKKRVSFLGQIWIEPGERELEALAEGVSRVLHGEETQKNYDR